MKPPIATPVLETEGTPVLSYSDIQNHLKLDGSADQTLVESLITVATKRVEQFIGRKLTSQEWSIYFDEFPSAKNDIWFDGMRDGHISQLSTYNVPLEVPFGPCSSIAFVRGYDSTDGTIAVDASNYQVDTFGPLTKIALRLGGQWPSATLRPLNGVHVKGTFGLGGTASVPLDIKHAIKIVVANLYENRGDNQSKSSDDDSAGGAIPKLAQTLLESYRLWKLR